MIHASSSSSPHLGLFVYFATNRFDGLDGEFVIRTTRLVSLSLKRDLYLAFRLRQQVLIHFYSTMRKGTTDASRDSKSL